MRKENARPAWKPRRASVREHEESIARDWPMTRREELALGALFASVATAITLLGVVATWI